MGIALTTVCARNAALAADSEATPKSKKRACVVNGIAHAAWTAYAFERTRKGEMKPYAGIATAGANGLLCAASLYVGLKKKHEKVLKASTKTSASTKTPASTVASK